MARSRGVPVGGIMTCIGGWNRNGLTEKRLPTPAELDAAAPLHGVYLSETGGGSQAVTNTRRARVLHRRRRRRRPPVAGTLSAGQGRGGLRSPSRRRTTSAAGPAEGIAHVAGLGLTMIVDVGGVPFADWVYPLLSLARGRLHIRLRQFFTGFDFPNLDGVKTFVNNNHDRSATTRCASSASASGSPPAPRARPPSPSACQFLGERGWTMILHSLSPTENQTHVDAFKVAAQSSTSPSCAATAPHQRHHARADGRDRGAEDPRRDPGLALHVGQRRRAVADGARSRDHRRRRHGRHERDLPEPVADTSTTWSRAATTPA